MGKSERYNWESVIVDGMRKLIFVRRLTVEARQKRYVLHILIATLVLFGCQTESHQPLSTEAIPTATRAPVSSPSVENIVQLAWFYKPPADEQIPLLIGRFDFFILTNHDEPEREYIRSLGENGPFYEYLLLAEIQDPGSCTSQPNGNQVAFRRGDFCMISQEHPDWFLLDTRSRRVSNERGYYYMDPGNEGFRAFWLERARELQQTYQWDGLFLDNAEASLGKYKEMNVRLMQYEDDASLQAAVKGFLSFLKQNYFTPMNRTVYANIVASRDASIWPQYLQYVDGAMLENFAVDWRTALSLDEWQEQIEMIQYAQAQGKRMILVAQGGQTDVQRQEFAFSSYLLVADGQTVFRYAHHSAYREIWWYETYQLDLGAPLGPFYKDGNSWKRTFENGLVTVNPVTQTASIRIDQ